MSSNIVDTIASGASPASITQEIKDTLFTKSAERIDDYRQVTATRLFDPSSEVSEEEWLWSSRKHTLIEDETNYRRD